jgi:uncharacterized protein YbdZ (MbtH family)
VSGMSAGSGASSGSGMPADRETTPETTPHHREDAMATAFGSSAFEEGSFLVLRNEAGECSLWPSGADVPEGWQAVLGPESRPACLAYVEQVWAPTPSGAR